MLGMIAVVTKFMAEAIIVAAVFGIMTRGGNILVRAFSGKEDFL